MATINQVLKALKRDIQSSMEDELAEELKEAHTKAAWEYVYNAYDNKVYVRRYDLDDPSNMDVARKGATLTLKNTTPPNTNYGGAANKDLIKVIETGKGYDYDPHPGARGFMEGTLATLEGGIGAAGAIEKGLLNRGWDVG